MVKTIEQIEETEDLFQRGMEIREYLGRLEVAQRRGRELRDKTILALLPTTSKSDISVLVGVGLSHIRWLLALENAKKRGETP